MRFNSFLDTSGKQEANDSGLNGHLMHLYDNRDLTFGEIKSILIDASKASLEQVTEKMDGMNLVFTYDLSEDAVKVSRGSEIKFGGMTAEDLAEKFKGRGQIEAAFKTAYRVVAGALTTVPDKVKAAVFGPAGNRWYSMEIIYAENPNVIQYDSNNVVFHGWPVFDRSPTGVVKFVSNDSGIETLAKYISKMQKAVEDTGWHVKGPTFVRMQKLTDGTILNDTLIKLNLAMSEAGVTDADNIRQYLKNRFEDEVSMLRLSPRISAAVVARCVEEPGCPTLTDIKKTSDKMAHGNITSFVKNSPAMTKTFMLPLEVAINGFAVELLRGLKSELVGDSGGEVQRLRDEVDRVIKSVEETGDPGELEILKRQMKRLGSVDNITSPVEGVVFRYKGNAYKFTGAFSAMNQILGIVKYKRRGKA